MARAGRHRDALVRTAMRLFRRQGYASTGLQQILSEAGVPKGSLYHHFPGGKEALGEAAVLLAGERVAELLRSLASEHEGDATGFVAAYCRRMGEWMRESGFQSGCPIATTLLETTPASPAITRAGNQVLDSWIRIIARAYRGAGLPAREARARAQALVAAVEGGLLLARVRRSERPLLELAAVLAP
jgi:TetR/AcrR family transcriptional repressor of lmrAB and yxaGH operons